MGPGHVTPGAPHRLCPVRTACGRASVGHTAECPLLGAMASQVLCETHRACIFGRRLAINTKMTKKETL